jgi:hypothetical protein
MGYAWDRPHLTINKGDYVKWSWSTPDMISGINYRVEQVNASISNEYNGGFLSGSSKPTGEYTYQFNEPG